MQVEFFAANPQEKARQKLDALLNKGVDRLAIACAFCTAAGVEILQHHAPRLRKPNSFVVVAASLPTDYPALDKLHSRIPGNLFVHWGWALPEEKKLGPALMHSKVFYAEAGDDCWLWTGSHNLTGSATQGANLEAAVLLSGKRSEQPFVDAVLHLEACKTGAAMYDPEHVPPSPFERADFLVIHAESVPESTGSLPWHVHLSLDTPDFDELLSPPADVRLLLYPIGSLAGGWRYAMPFAAYSGSLTGQNLTARNPKTRRAGTSANWPAASYSIAETGGVLQLGPGTSPGAQVTTQAVLHILEPANAADTLFADKPKVEHVYIEGQRKLTTVDYDLRRFFRSSSIEGASLVHVPIIERRSVIRLPAAETRERDIPRLRNLLAPKRNLDVETTAPSDATQEKKHPFIAKVRYRARE